MSIPMRVLIKDLKSLAFQIPAPNAWTPQFLQLALQMDLCIRPPGQTPRGTSMPQTRAEWAYLGSQYDKAFIEQLDINSNLRAKVDKQAQKIDKLRRGRKFDLEENLSLKSQLDGANSLIKIQREYHND